MAARRAAAEAAPAVGATGRTEVRIQNFLASLCACMSGCVWEVSVYVMM